MGLLIWIVVQIIVIRAISFLQPTIFLIGLTVALHFWNGMKIKGRGEAFG